VGPAEVDKPLFAGEVFGLFANDLAGIMGGHNHNTQPNHVSTQQKNLNFSTVLTSSLFLCF
jgi:hypothetical protein